MRFLFFLTLLFLPNLLLAGELFMESSEEMPGVASPFLVYVFVSSAEEANVVAGTLNFDTEVFDVKKINTGSSIVSFWIEKPSERQSGAINFSGMVAGGFTSSQVKLFSVEFVPRLATESELNISNQQLLAHDGRGTSLPIDAMPFLITTKSALFANEEVVKDVEPPESFTPIVVKRDDWLDGKAVLIFDTTDKDSGVEAYYLKEVAYSWLAPLSSWRLVTSPYEIKDQSLRNFIYLRAQDKAGNNRLVMIEPEDKRPVYPFLLIPTFLLVVVFLVKKKRV